MAWRRHPAAGCGGRSTGSSRRPLMCASTPSARSQTRDLSRKAGAGAWPTSTAPPSPKRWRTRRPAGRAAGGRVLPLPRREHRLGECRDQGPGCVARATPDRDRQCDPRLRARLDRAAGRHGRAVAGLARSGRARRTLLSKLRRSVPYTLSEPEERLLNERDATALKAWQTLFNRHVSTLAADFNSGSGSEPAPVSQLTSFLGYRTGTCAGKPTRRCASWWCPSSRSWRSATTRSSPTDCWSTGSAAIPSRCCPRISRTSWRPVTSWRCSMRSKPRTRSRSGGYG